MEGFTMITGLIIGLIIVAFILWMVWEVNHAHELPPDYDYDREIDRIINEENKNHNNPASM